MSTVFASMGRRPRPGAPLKGANSFTEGQAKDRALAAGFTSVSGPLDKDGAGIWRGNAMKDGQDRQGRGRLQGQCRHRNKRFTETSSHGNQSRASTTPMARLAPSWPTSRRAGIASSDINLIANKYICDETPRHRGAKSATRPSAGVGAALGGTAGLLAGLGVASPFRAGSGGRGGSPGGNCARRRGGCGHRRRDRRAGRAPASRKEDRPGLLLNRAPRRYPGQRPRAPTRMPGFCPQIMTVTARIDPRSRARARLLPRRVGTVRSRGCALPADAGARSTGCAAVRTEKRRL